MKLLSIDKSSFILTRHPYSNMCAVNCSDYIFKTGHCYKLLFDVGLVTHLVKISDVLTLIMPPNMASIMEIKCGSERISPT